MKSSYKIVTLICLLSNLFISAQFAKLIDKDGYVNIRKTAGLKSSVVGKVNSDEIVYVYGLDEKDKNWSIIDYSNKNGDVITGYIHNSRIKYVNSYEEIPSTVYDNKKAIFILKNIKVNIFSDQFNYKENKKFFSSTKYGDQLVEDKFKGQQIWGTDGTIPKTYYKSITVTIGNKTTNIPQKEIENLFNVNNENSSCYFDSKTDTIYITSLNSDGAGGYEVLFKIEKGEYKGRIMIMPF